jgi:hypothetical protein
MNMHIYLCEWIYKCLDILYTSINVSLYKLLYFRCEFSSQLLATILSIWYNSSLIIYRYSVGDAPNGGYMMSLAITAALECISFPDPLSISGHYVNKG